MALADPGTVVTGAGSLVSGGQKSSLLRRTAWAIGREFNRPFPRTA